MAAVISEGAEKGIRICRTQGAGGGSPFMADAQDSAAEAGAKAKRVAGHPFLCDGRMVAAMASYLVDAVGVHADTVLACPATYSVEELATLRAALDAGGLARIALTPAPIAAAAWLEMQWKPEKSAVTLVYDLGGGLDITLLRIDPDYDARIVGRPLRSSAFGGRAFSALLAHYAHDLTADTTSPGLPGDLPDAAVAELRAEFIRSSMPLLYECIRSAELTPADIDRVLLVGGAARPAEVARVLADELGCPVVTTADSAHCVATGAAALAARGIGGTELLVPSPRTSLPAKAVAALAGAAAVLATAGVVSIYDANPAEPSDPQAQALDLREIVPLSPFGPDRAGRNGEHEDRADSTQPHTVRWAITDYAVGQPDRALCTEVAASPERPDTPLGPPHSTPKPDAAIVESSNSGTPQMPIRLPPSRSGGLRPGTGEPAELPSAPTIPTAGSVPPPKSPTGFDLGSVSVGSPIASTANTSGRSGAPAIAQSVSTSSAASAGSGGRSATSTSSRPGASTRDQSVAGTRSRTTGSDSHTGASTPTGLSRRSASDASTGTSTSSRSGGNPDSDSGTSASRQSGGSTGGSSGTHAGSGSAGNTGSRGGS
ncbi:Hsp70 family protein [Nocardia gipuzkoensis]